jgi:hypothetical protein
MPRRTSSRAQPYTVLGAHVSSERIGEQTAFKRMLPDLVACVWDIHSCRLDAGFDSTQLRDMLVEVGFDPYVPYRDNRINAIPRVHVGKVKHPEVLERLFHLFSMQNEEFKREYGSRAKAECLFSSIERVFGNPDDVHLRCLSEARPRSRVSQRGGSRRSLRPFACHEAQRASARNESHQSRLRRRPPQELKVSNACRELRNALEPAERSSPVV